MSARFVGISELAEAPSPLSSTSCMPSLILCASFVVAGATARLLQARASGTITFVVTGDDGNADEDLACAQYIARRADGGTGVLPW